MLRKLFLLHNMQRNVGNIFWMHCCCSFPPPIMYKYVAQIIPPPVTLVFRFLFRHNSFNLPVHGLKQEKYWENKWNYLISAINLYIRGIGGKVLQSCVQNVLVIIILHVSNLELSS